MSTTNEASDYMQEEQNTEPSCKSKQQPDPNPLFEDVGGSGDASQSTSPPSHGNKDCSSSSPPSNKYAWITKLRNFLKSHRLDLAMWVLRFVTCFFTTFSVVPIFGNSGLFARRALIASAATSALRLHQRLEMPFSLSREYFTRIVIEDACHYLFFSLIFLFLGQISFALIPITLFSSVHFANFSLKILEAVKGRAVIASGVGSFLYVWTHKTSWILRMAAISEIALMGLIILGVLRGNVSFFMPFVYYRFLTFRYASRRNHFTRVVFREMRIYLEKFAMSGNCPVFLQRLIRNSIQLLCKLAPPIAPQP